MKVFAVILLAILATTSAQDPENFSRDLMAAQRELDLTYETFQNSYILVRNQMSGILFNIQQRVIESFLEAYADAKALEASTNVAMAAFPDNSCVNIVRTRWNISIRRYGAQLSGCLRAATTLLYPATQYLNVQAVTSQATSNQVMSLGTSQMGQLQSFTSPNNNIPFAINRSLRIFFFRAREYLLAQENFVRDFVADQDEIVRGLIDCDQVTLAQFYYETVNVLTRAGNC